MTLSHLILILSFSQSEYQMVSELVKRKKIIKAFKRSFSLTAVKIKELLYSSVKLKNYLGEIPTENILEFLNRV